MKVRERINMATNRRGPQAGNLPLYALITAGGFLALAVAAIIFTDPDKQTTPVFMSVIGLILTTIPSLIAAGFAERASRDIRNGVVEEKAKDGAKQALVEHQVITRDGPAMTLAMSALASLLEKNTSATQANTAAQNSVPDEATKVAVEEGLDA